MEEEEKKMHKFSMGLFLVFLNKKPLYFTDYWRAYAALIAQEKHFAIGRGGSLIIYIERFNCTLRQRCLRLVRKSLSFSNSLDKYIEAMKYFIC